MIHNGFFPGFSVTVRSVLCWCSVFWLFTAHLPGGVEGVSLLPFLLGSIAVYAALRFYLRKERTMLALVLACVLCGGVLAVALGRWFSTFTGNGGWLFISLSVLSTTYLSARFCVEGTTAARSITSMELTTLLFLICLWVQSTVGAGVVYSLPMFVALLLSLVEVCYLRLAGSSRSTRWGLGVVAAVLIVIFGLMGLFLAFGAESLAQALVMLSNAVTAFVKWVAAGAYRLLLWFFSRLPEVEVDASVSYAMPEQFEIPETADPSTASIALFVVAAGGLAAYALILLLQHLGKLQVGGKKIRSGGKVQRKRPSLKVWLLGAWKAFAGRVYMEWQLLRHKNTPQALYLFLLRSGRVLQFKQEKGESPAAFIRRMSAMTEENLRRDLRELAAALEIALYAAEGSNEFFPEAANRIRRSFRRELRRARAASIKRKITAWKENRTA